MDLKEYVKFENWKATFKVKITPKSAKNEFFWILDNGVLKMRIKWVPEKGKVNKEIIAFIAKSLGTKKSNVKIAHWLTDQNKTIEVHTV